MRQWYQDWYGTEVPVASMGSSMHGMSLHEATSIDGALPFDKAFVEQMIPHHQMAVMMSTMAKQGVSQPELRTLLDSIVASQTAEIVQMQGWYQAWYEMPVAAGNRTGDQGMGSMGEHHMTGAHPMQHGPGVGPMGSMGGHSMGGGSQVDRQQTIHEAGASVMPFDLSQTLHHFVALPDGEMQTVTANDPSNQTQISLIQLHLADEATRFQRPGNVARSEHAWAG